MRFKTLIRNLFISDANDKLLVLETNAFDMDFLASGKTLKVVFQYCDPRSIFHSIGLLHLH